MNTYQKIGDRREQILEAASELAVETHYRDIRRHHLADRCGMAAGNISRVTGDMDQMRSLLIRYAFDHQIYIIIAQAIMDKHPEVEHLDAIARRKVLVLAA